jgi:hypothetical protein
LLVALVRPSEPEIREQDSTTMGAGGRACAVPTVFRLSVARYVHAQPPCIVPDVDIDPRPTRSTALVSLTTESRRTDSSIDLTRTSRGPPRG